MLNIVNYSNNSKTKEELIKELEKVTKEKEDLEKRLREVIDIKISLYDDYFPPRRDDSNNNNKTTKEEEYDGHKAWEEKQNWLRSLYEDPYYCEHYKVYRLECVYCQNIFYSRMPFTKYCNYYCSADTYVNRRRERNPPKSYSRLCLYCQAKFYCDRRGKYYCCSSHRVLASFERKKEKPTHTTWWNSPMRFAFFHLLPDPVVERTNSKQAV